MEQFKAAHVPMQQVEVQVVCAQLLQGVLEGHLDVFRVVVVFEQFGSDEQLGSGDASSLDTVPNLGFITVTPCTAAY